MLEWIAGYVARWAGLVADSTIDLVHWIAHAIAGVVYDVFVHVGRAWEQVLAALEEIDTAAGLFGRWVWVRLRQITLTDIPQLWRAIVAGLRAAIDLEYHLYDKSSALATRYYLAALEAVADAEQWALRTIFEPLADAAQLLRADLLKWGYVAWFYVTHPDRLAPVLLDALIAALESSFWRVAGPAGRFVLALLLHNARRLALLLEAIVTAAL